MTKKVDYRSVTFFTGGTLEVADDYDQVVIVGNFEIVGVQAYLQSSGGTAGNTDFVLEKNGTDIWTVGTGVGRIAYNGTKYQNIALTSLTSRFLRNGDILQLNINAVPTIQSAGLKLRLWLKAISPARIR